LGGAGTRTPPTPATWITGGHLTPIRRYAGFDHTADPFFPRSAPRGPALGLDALGPTVSIDAASQPYGGSHELLTSVAVPRELLAAHNSTAVDQVAPHCQTGRPSSDQRGNTC